MKTHAVWALSLALLACAGSDEELQPSPAPGDADPQATLDAGGDDVGPQPGYEAGVEPRYDLGAVFDARPRRDRGAVEDWGRVDGGVIPPRDAAPWRDQWVEADRGVRWDARPPRDAELWEDQRPIEDARPPQDRPPLVEDAEPEIDAPLGCEEGEACNPIVIDELPFEHDGDTRWGWSEIDSYACAPGTNEGGPEIHYSLWLDEPGQLSIEVEDGPGVDIDIHLLQGGECLQRDDARINARVEPGAYEIIADTWVNASGDVLSGPYTLSVGFAAVPSGACAVEQGDLRMFWGSCDPGLDCYESGGERYVRLPSSGPVVKEAHLVTDEDGFGAGWPSTSREGLDAHYARSQAATDYAMERTEAWAPAGEGGSEYGQGSTGVKVPLIAEAWYVNMYWRDRPERGTRMIIINPANGRAVVAAAGYETGPGDNGMIGGVTEEIHDYLGTGHRSTLTLGFAVDQNLPYGPIDCD